MRETEGCGTALDGVRATEDGVQIIRRRVGDIEIEQQPLHVDEQLLRLFKEGAEKLAKVEVHICRLGRLMRRCRPVGLRMPFKQLHHRIRQTIRVERLGQETRRAGGTRLLADRAVCAARGSG